MSNENGVMKDETVQQKFEVETLITSDGKQAVRIKRGSKIVTHLEHTVPSWMLSEE